MTDGPELRVDRDGAVLRIEFNRPARLNAVTIEVVRQAADAIERAADDPDTRVIVLSGAGPAFCVGADLTAAADLDASSMEQAGRLIRAITDVPKPVLAVVHGAAAGFGCSVAVACDLIWAAESAYFLLAFTGIGLLPDGGTTATIPAAIGRARAARMALLAERVPARQAFDWGLISAVVADDELADAAAQVVAKLADGPTVAYAETKKALRATGLPDIEAALDRESTAQQRLLAGQDFAEGARAFTERRAARFVGR